MIKKISLKLVDVPIVKRSWDSKEINIGLFCFNASFSNKNQEGIVIAGGLGSYPTTTPKEL